MASPRIDFHSGMADKVAYACRLLRKATAQGAQVVVCGDSASLDRLDQALWTFEALAFVPHLRLRRNAAAPAARLARTATWLVDDIQATPHRGVLVNLGPQVATGFEQFERVIELLGDDAADRDAGRQRWRHYLQQGLTVVNHEQGATA